MAQESAREGGLGRTKRRRQTNDGPTYAFRDGLRIHSLAVVPDAPVTGLSYSLGPLGQPTLCIFPLAMNKLFTFVQN